MSTIVTLGEQLGRVTCWHEGPVRAGSAAELSVCGAETTVAIGVRRLGVAARFLGRVGDDTFGRIGRAVLSSEGVDVAGVVIDDDAPTGVLVRSQRTAERVVVEYLRRGSAGSRLHPGDIDPTAIETADLLHITGITPALSRSAADAVDKAIALAKHSGVLISFDVNYRAALWTTDVARHPLRRLAAQADVVIGGAFELALLGGDFGEICALGPREIVRTEGPAGATAWLDGHSTHVPAGHAQVVDVVGAGDAFVAGFLAELLVDAPLSRCLDTAVLMGAFAVSVPGDCELLPTRSELREFAAATDVNR